MVCIQLAVGATELTNIDPAIANIPAIGRSKWSENGRLRGRNELISAWIERKTGRVLHRKQISSHIQLLGTFLKGIPECSSRV